MPEGPRGGLVEVREMARHGDPLRDSLAHPCSPLGDRRIGVRDEPSDEEIRERGLVRAALGRGIEVRIGRRFAVRREHDARFARRERLPRNRAECLRDPRRVWLPT